MQNLSTEALKSPFRPLSLSHASLAVVGLMWVLPFLHYRHQYPLTTFYQEWWSALLGVLAVSLLATRDFWQQPEIPRIVHLPVALLGIVLLQAGLGRMVYADQALLYALYLLFATLLMMLGAQLRDRLGLMVLATVLAVFLLVGAELSALVGVLQHYRWDTPLNPVIVMKVSSSVYGNLAQSNHFADYIALGLVSLGLLFQESRIKAPFVVLLALPLLFVMTLSGSRSSWLYLLLMAGLAWRWASRDVVLRPLLRYSLLLIGGLGLMHLVVQLPFMAGVNGSVDTVQRLFGDDASGGIRLYLWREAVMMFAQSPWLGAGFGQFAWQHFQLLPVLQAHGITGLYNNAHNLIFQLAAEAGLAGLLALAGSLVVWLRGLGHAAAGPANWWGGALLGVLGIHSLLEYPLWYTYFVAIAAFLLGALDETRYRLELRNVGRLSMVAVILLGLMTLAQLYRSYPKLEGVLTMRAASAADRGAFERVRDGLVEVYRESLLSPYAELFMTSLVDVNAERIEEKLELNGRVMRFAPISAVAYRQALLLAQAGRQEQAIVALKQAVWSYPADLAAVMRQIALLAEKDPAHFSALLKSALQEQQERQRAVRHQ